MTSCVFSTTVGLANADSHLARASSSHPSLLAATASDVKASEGVLAAASAALSKDESADPKSTATSIKLLAGTLEGAVNDLRHARQITAPHLARKLRPYAPLLKRIRQLSRTLGDATTASASRVRTGPLARDANLLGNLEQVNDSLLGDAASTPGQLTKSLPRLIGAVESDVGDVASSIGSAADSGGQTLLIDLHSDQGTIQAINTVCSTDGLAVGLISLAQGATDPVTDGATGMLGGCAIITGGILLLVQAEEAHPNFGLMAIDAGSMITGSAVEYAGTIGETADQTAGVAGEVIGGADQAIDTVFSGNNAQDIAQILTGLGTTLAADWRGVASLRTARAVGASKLLANIYTLQEILGLLFPSVSAPTPPPGPSGSGSGGSPPPTPTIASFEASESAMPSYGGDVELSVSVANASSCDLNVTPAITGLPTSEECESGRANFYTNLPENTSTTPITYTFTLTVTGAPGSTAATATIKVTVGVPRSFGSCAFASAGPSGLPAGEPYPTGVSANTNSYACIVAVNDNGGQEATSTGIYGVQISFTPPMELAGISYQSGLAVVTQTDTSDSPEPGNTNTVEYEMSQPGLFSATVGVDDRTTESAGDLGFPETYTMSSHLDVVFTLNGQVVASEAFIEHGQTQAVSFPVAAGEHLAIACSNVEGEELGSPSKPGEVDIVNPTVQPLTQ